MIKRKTTFNNDPTNKTLMETLTKIDPEVLREAFYVADFALNDVRTIKMVEKETGIPEEVIMSFCKFFLDLRDNPSVVPEINDVESLNKHCDDIKNLMQ